MRIPISASLVALAVATATVAHVPASGVISARKSLGFGHDLPHAVFNTSPEQLVQGFADHGRYRDDPYAAASTFVLQLLGRDGQLSQLGNTFELRDDSYTDDNTGVTHAYYRQYINGLEVADAHINVNVRDGVILSYGDSFYRGPVPETLESPASQQGLPTVWEEQCPKLHATLINAVNDNYVTLLESGKLQLPLDGSASHNPASRHLTHLMSTNCLSSARSSEASLFLSSSDGFGSARDATLAFMMAATPNGELSEDILQRYDYYADGISSSFETHFSPHGQSRTLELLSGVPDTVNPVKAHMAFVQVPNGDSTELALVWKLEVEMQDNWYETAVSASPPHKIISVVDWASDFVIPVNEEVRLAPIPEKPREWPTPVYNVFPWGVNDPECGDRTIEKEGVDKLASPMGWHSISAANDPLSNGQLVQEDQINNYTITVGNNVFAQENWEGIYNWEDNYRPDAGASMVFDFPYEPHKTNSSTDAYVEAKKHINTTVTQLFYTVNMVHDLYYRYGFDEKSGNFQQDNFGRGGRDHDAVIANAQDGSGYNNANFMTPPDGQNGRCRMYLWNTANPYRDGDLEAGIVIHELTHGLSIRLTGGPMNSGCLGWGESGGMGEGWGDFLATMIRSTKDYQDYAMGAWAANRVKGIRNYIYSLNETTNPSKYKTLDGPGYWGVHAIGEVWAEILWVTAQRLIEKHGFTETLFPPLPNEDGIIPEGDFYRPISYDASGRRKPLVPKHGNSLIIQLVIDAMKLQKCMPSFFDARDAIIQADQILTGGENFCDFWYSFSKRGLGVDATVQGRTPWGGGIRTNGHAVPSVCQETNEPEPDLPGDDDDDDSDSDDDDE